MREESRDKRQVRRDKRDSSFNSRLAGSGTAAGRGAGSHASSCARTSAHTPALARARHLATRREASRPGAGHEAGTRYCKLPASGIFAAALQNAHSTSHITPPPSPIRDTHHHPSVISHPSSLRLSTQQVFFAPSTRLSLCLAAAAAGAAPAAARTGAGAAGTAAKVLPKGRAPALPKPMAKCLAVAKGLAAEPHPLAVALRLSLAVLDEWIHLRMWSTAPSP